MEPSHISLLERMPIFGAIRQDVLEFLLQRAGHRCVLAGEWFVREGEPGEAHDRSDRKVGHGDGDSLGDDLGRGGVPLLGNADSLCGVGSHGVRVRAGGALLVHGSKVKVCP